MRENEFNPNMDSEFSLPQNQEISLAIDWQPSQEDVSIAPEFVSSEEFGESGSSKNQGTAKNGRISASDRKRLLKMMMGTVGAVTVLSSTGLVDFSNPHANCSYSGRYDRLFEEIIDLADSEEYITLAELIDSEEMEDCIDTLFPGVRRDAKKEENGLYIDFVYNDKYVTNCHTEYKHTEYDSDDRNVFVCANVAHAEGFDGEYRNNYTIYITPMLNMSEEYISKADALEVTKITVQNHYPPTQDADESSEIQEKLISYGILDFPPDITVEKVTIIDYDSLENYKRYEAATCSFENDMGLYDIKYLSPISIFTSEYWNNGPKGHAVAKQRYDDNENYTTFDFVIDDEGHAIAEQSFWSQYTSSLDMTTGIEEDILTTTSLADDENNRVYYEQIYSYWGDSFNSLFQN